MFVPDSDLAHELWLGDLLLTGETVDDDGHLFTIQALDEETTWGNPVPIDVAVQRWMADGAVASTQGHENRELYFKALVSAETSADLAAGEAALMARAGATTLTWVPPEGTGLAPASVFEVWTWHLEHEFNGRDERYLQRLYGVRCTAEPWARSSDLTTVAANPVGTPTTTVIDNCSTLAAWIGSPNTPTLVGGTSVRETNTGAPGFESNVILTRNGSVTGLGTTPYLAIDMSTSGFVSGRTLSVYVSGGSISGGCTLVAQVGTVSYWRMPTGITSFTTLEVTAWGTATSAGSMVLTISDVSATNAISGIGSTKQLTRSIVVGGSVPTSGSLKIASPSSTALGTVLAYTGADDEGSSYSPTMRQYRSSGNTTTVDAAAVSGSHEALVTTGAGAGTITYTVPAANYREGTYAVVGRFFADSTATLTATVTAAITGYTADSILGKVTWPSANTWQWGVIGVLILPPQSVPADSTVNMVVTLAGAGGGTITLDELYLLDVTHGAVSLIACGSVATKLWLDAPDADPDRNRPAVYLGTQDDRSDAANARYDQILSLGDHDLAPGGAAMLTVTDGVGSALASATFYRRWHTHAGA